MTVSTTTTAVSAAGDGSTTDFTFTFEILAAEDLKVIVVTDSTGAESEKTLTTDYTVAGVGQVNGGTVTFVTAPASGETVHIKRGNMALTQPTNYTPNDPFPAETHENALDRVALQIQQINEKLGRAIVRSETDSASAQLPINETIKGKTLAFNETTGAVEAGPSVADVGTVSGIAADIATLADIEDGTDATDAIQTVASISSNVSTVAGISSDVTNVSNNAANVSTVASDSSNIATVSGNISDVNTVSSNITSVNTVATNIADVITVANDLNEAISEVETVANDLNEAVSEIDTVAGSISNVDTVGTNIANINTVAGISGNVTTVAGISSNVTTVAGVSADVTTVAGISANVTTVAGISSNVSTVAGISSDVTTVAGVSANVTTVATDITNVNTVATNIADVNNFALTYRIAASAPATSLDEGDLYFDTTQNKMFVYDGSAWVTVSPDLVADTSPQLGGNLDLNGNNITGTGNISTTGTATFTGDLTVDTNTLYVDSTNNRVGIKTSSPSAALHILDTSTPQAKIAYDSNRYMNVEHATIYNVSGAAQSNNLKFATRGNSGNNNITFFTGGTDASGTSESQRLLIANNGDISFYNSTGVSQDFFWDSSASRLTLSSSDYHFGISTSGNQPWYLRGVSDGSFRVHLNGTGDIVTATSSGYVGISTSSPQNELDVRGTVEIGNGSTQRMYLQGTGNDFRFYDRANLAERLRIDSSGNVGIKTTSPDLPLTVDNSSGAAGSVYAHISMGRGTSNRYQIATIKDTPTNDAVGIVFRKGTTEQMRIDSGGNLLVGGTSLGENGAVTMAGDGRIYAIRASDTAGFFGRTTTDGSIVKFTKDGSEVGSIGSRGAGTSYIILKSSAGAGAGLTGSDNAILPMDESALADANTSLGNGSYRFKDLHLSNSVLAGATSGRGGAATGHLFKMPSGDVYFEIMGSTTSANTDILFSDGTGGSYGVVGYDHTNDALRFFANSGEKMRIDSSGNLLVGKTANSIGGSGVVIRGGGELFSTRAGDVAGFNRLTTDGPIVQFYKDSSVVGSIGNDSNNLYVVFSNANNIGLAGGSPATIFPTGNTGAVRDNAVDLGYASGRFDDIYATNGTIQTSDQNEKQQIASLTDAEIVAAKAISQLFKTFKWNDKVAAKGDAARRHTGVVA
jgi:hypothetical protein